MDVPLGELVKSALTERKDLVLILIVMDVPLGAFIFLVNKLG